MSSSTPLSRKLIARIWHGRTRAEIAQEYTRYLYENGVRKIAAIPNNRGTQMLRKVEDGIGDFTVISYWDSVEAIKQYAGEDYERTNVLPRDPEYLLEVEPRVRHLEVLVNDWTPAK